MKKTLSLMGILLTSVLLLTSAVGVEAKGYARSRSYSPARGSSYAPARDPYYAPEYRPAYGPINKPSYVPPVAPQPPVAPSYNCGPYMDTYVVHSLDSRSGMGVRCVKWGNTGDQTGIVPAFSWYGEGNWYGCSYRHVGQAMNVSRYGESGVYQGFSSDIMGNGECANATYPGNLQIKVIDGNTIRVTGGWNEEWQRVSSVNYAPLAAPTACGAYFQQYRVMSAASYAQQRDQGYTNDASSGLRCVLNVGPKLGTWYGVGNWSGQTYSHLGMNTAQGHGASDVCRPGEICNNMSAGSLYLKYTTDFNGYYVNGWNEVWMRS